MKISLIATVKDAEPFVGEFLASVRAQTRRPDEVVIVDGGSSDGTAGILRDAEMVTLIEEPGANISRGRAAAIAAATHDAIAVTDADCVLDHHWLERLEALLEDGAGVAMGFYRPIAQNFFQVCSASVHLPEPEEIDAATFMPSSRSIAFRRDVYEAAGGYPEWLDIGEDMYLNHAWRKAGADMRFDPSAIAYWRVRPTLGQTWRQYSGYARGDAIAGMFPQRHAVRFATYATAIVLASLRTWRLLLLAGLLAYAFKPVKRAFEMLPDAPGKRIVSLAAVPAMMAFTDVAKMYGYVSGLMTRKTDRKGGSDR